MNDHPSAQNLEFFAAGALSPSDFLSIDDHLADCEGCRSRLAELKDTRVKVERLHLQLQSAEMAHLEYEDLEAYLDHRCDETDREIMDSHLQLCSLCAQQVRELQALVPVRRSFFQQATFLWKSPDYAGPFRFAALAAVLASFALILALAARSPDQGIRAQLKQETEKNQRSSEELKAAKLRIAELEDGNSTEPLVAAVHDNSNLVGLTKSGGLQGAESFPGRYRQMAQSALQDQRVLRPEWLKELQGQAVTLMGKTEAESFQVKNPMGRVVESDRPLFVWDPLPGAAQYRVDVYDTNFRPVASSGPLRVPSWSPGAPLPRGLTYLWKVTATLDGKELVAPVPPAPEARFKVLEEAKAAELTDLRKSGSHFLLGLAYADSGMIPEARSEFEALLHQNPDSALAQNLLKSLD